MRQGGAELDAGAFADVEEAAQAGWKAMSGGGSAVNAVEAAVLVLEDNPLFNAGVGPALNSEGCIETDAAIIDGSSLNAGAVAAVTGIGNPIHLARRVMEVGPAVLLVAKGAEQFARSQGIPTWDSRRSPSSGVMPTCAITADGVVTSY